MTCKPRQIIGNEPFSAIPKDYNRYCDKIIGSGFTVLNPLRLLIDKYNVPGLIFDNSPPTAFQDAAGTTAADTGDVVGRLNDLSGGNHDLSQSTTAAKPILRAGPLLEFDGIDDFMGGTNPFTGDELTLIWCGKFPSGAPAANKFILSIGDSSDDSKYVGWLVNTSSNFVVFSTGAIGAVSATVAVPDLTILGIYSTRLSATVEEASFNQSRVPGIPSTPLSLSIVDQFSLNSLLRTTASNFAEIDSGYLFMINAYLTDIELSQAEQYIADICGVTLP